MACTWVVSGSPLVLSSQAPPSSARRKTPLRVPDVHRAAPT